MADEPLPPSIEDALTSLGNGTFRGDSGMTTPEIIAGLKAAGESRGLELGLRPTTTGCPDLM